MTEKTGKSRDGYHFKMRVLVPTTYGQVVDLLRQIEQSCAYSTNLSPNPTNHPLNAERLIIAAACKAARTEIDRECVPLWEKWSAEQKQTNSAVSGLPKKEGILPSDSGKDSSV